MNIQQFIESGIIEDYCLGLLNSHQRDELVQNAVKYKEIRTAINVYEQALKKYSEDLFTEGKA
jgi:hypothetical protein